MLLSILTINTHFVCPQLNNDELFVVVDDILFISDKKSYMKPVCNNLLETLAAQVIMSVILYCLSVRLSLCLPVCSSAFLPACLSVCLSVLISGPPRIFPAVLISATKIYFF